MFLQDRSLAKEKSEQKSIELNQTVMNLLWVLLETDVEQSHKKATDSKIHI